ncbi:MAG TPA: hypothetical protein VL525_12470 [Mucilaginibacter sp.]|jgi:hypothetical protein|nr:hypothetical protein [Mucilaginibacter sp.]
MPGKRLSLFDRNSNDLLLKITCLFWLFAKLLSWRIWTTNRLLPVVPLFKILDGVPAVVHTAVFLLSLGLILLAFFKPGRTALLALLFVEIFSCVLDINRLLPWEYQYVFTILIFLLNFKRTGYIPACIAFVLVSTYFYGGACKLNEDFVRTVWNILILKFFLKIPVHVITQSWVHYSGYLLGVIELLAGVGLLFRKTQVWSAIVLITMHIFILLLFSPFGYRGYRVLWPWNTSMIVFLYVIFLRGKERVLAVRPLLQGMNGLVLVFWGFLPALSFIGYWDYNLSSALFAANIPKMTICVADTVACKPLQRFFNRNSKVGACRGQAKADIQAWAIAETGVSAYPQVWVYKRIQEKLEKQYPSALFTFTYFNHYPKNK